jgi:hypothetical protein
MRRISWKIVGLSVGALAGLVHGRAVEAQALPQVNQAQEVQRVQALETPQESAKAGDPSLYDGEESDTGDQVILATAPSTRWNWISLSVDSQYFYTSNASLSPTHADATEMLVNTIDAELDAPSITVPYGSLFTHLGYEYQWFDYGIGGASDHFSDLDFDSATLYAGAQYSLPDNWWAYVDLSYNRLLNDGNGYDEFYKELVPEFSLQKVFTLEKNLEATVEYSGNYRFTDEVPYPSLSRSCNNRTDEALDFELTWQVTPKIDLRPFYRFQYSYYPSYFEGSARNDFLHTFGVAADYSFNSWSSIRVFLDYDLLDTDAASVGDYRKLDVGGGLSAGIKF